MSSADVDVDVVVVGAGLSGLCAARRLMDSGASVRVLEARERVGGRTWSKDIGGATFDVGGQWIGPGQRRLAALTAELGLSRFPTFDDGKKVLDLDGAISEYRSQIPNISIPALLQMQAALTLLDRQQKLVPARDPLGAANAAELDRQTLDSFRRKFVKLKSVNGLLDVAVRVIFGAEAGEIGLLYFLAYLNAGGGLLKLAEIRGGAQQDRFVEGAQSVSKRLAAKLGDAVVLNAPVSRIRQQGGGVEVVSAQGTVRARRCVVAVPPALAGRIDYEPSLPGRRDQLTQRVPMGNTVKLLCTYKQAFWRERGYSGEVVSTTGPMSVVFDNTSHDGKVPMLLGFVVAKHARGWSERAPEQRRALVTDSLVRYFGNDAADIDELVEQDWSTEPYSRGCPVGVMGPGTYSACGDALREPVGSVHWAGTETATEWTGYLEGAIQAGERAADEVVAALGLPARGA
jgi:monoamine oxidase